MSKINQFIVEASDLVEVVRRWTVTVPAGVDPEEYALEVAEEDPPDDIEQVPTEPDTVWTVTDAWGTLPGSPMWGVPPEGDPFWEGES